MPRSIQYSVRRSVKPRSKSRLLPFVWPELMDAATASRFLGERSRQTFRRRVGKVYPRPRRIPGRGNVWTRVELEAYVASIQGGAGPVADLADEL